MTRQLQAYNLEYHHRSDLVNFCGCFYCKLWNAAGASALKSLHYFRERWDQRLTARFFLRLSQDSSSSSEKSCSSSSSANKHKERVTPLQTRVFTPLQTCFERNQLCMWHFPRNFHSVKCKKTSGAKQQRGKWLWSKDCYIHLVNLATITLKSNPVCPKGLFWGDSLSGPSCPCFVSEDRDDNVRFKKSKEVWCWSEGKDW